jgi:hypothetical protein
MVNHFNFFQGQPGLSLEISTTPMQLAWISIQNPIRQQLSNAQGYQKRKPSGKNLSALQETNGLAESLGKKLGTGEILQREMQAGLG